ncbi:cobyrinic acid a,c-diamide synthase [Litorivivens lipolytica]|uniref:Cobyrinic acid a,c-diamide synthase n=1 Tax=Litorivivens lipolytica TaxID=1524264 RepID=A0A7W4W4R2_9GAMM|nr:cobyrinate a,c-diamide synthase [Litorivivens lipolytica]MBB3046857.1 cobyrinic acid a,c-diamide synthase [Litorivivens lipolytica]
MTAKLMILASPGSNHGKTLLSAGFAKALLDRGDSVTLFKMGPDYLDPKFLQKATGLDVRQIDYWMLGADGIAAELQRAAQHSEYILIEGVMGLFDGSFPVSKLAVEYGIPVTLTVEAAAMAQTFGAVVHGLATYDPQVNVSAVLANRVGSDNHGAMLKDSVRAPVKYLGWLKRDPRLQVEERHLGISSSEEQAQDCAELVAEVVAPMLDDIEWGQLESLPQAEIVPAKKALQGLKIAVANDVAFNFLYHANIDFLREQGAELIFFSPLNNSQLPSCDALYLPGGYPELHLERLCDNETMADHIREHILSGKPCVAECGGMLYLQSSLTYEGNQHTLLGLLPGNAVVGERLAAIGYQQAPNEKLKGHTFHYAAIPDARTDERARFHDGREGEFIWRRDALVASFVHWYFRSDPDTVCAWFRGEPA